MIGFRLVRILAALALAAPAVPLLAQPQEGANPAVWAGEPTTGVLTHRATGATFPAAYGIFKRSRIVALAPDGSDVAINYDAQDGETHTRLSIFLYHPRPVPEHGLKGALAAIAARSPQAFVWADGPFSIAAPGNSPVPLRAFKGTYKTGAGPSAVMDYLYLAELGGWAVKMRATITKVRDPSQEEAIDLIFRQLPWAAVLAANGECRGPACQTKGPAQFNSHMVESMLPAVLAKRIPFDIKAERNLPEVARTATPPLGEAVIRRSTKDPLVYFTEVKDLGAFRLVKLPANVAQMVDGSFGKISVEGPIYGVAIDSAGNLLMPRFFAGEPTPAQFGAVVRELVLHSTASPFVTVAETVAAMPDQ
ncbi:hypothetical protein ACFB49_03420 [Sphingomonas sp. DBB INV C78]|uniref:hypothetical protein n=1 Tax=Sphingomonas sp. DBB INV C78 TaxID=3349434 RepID=UPI0036D300AA